jgi:hypothetical protein
MRKYFCCLILLALGGNIVAQIVKSNQPKNLFGIHIQNSLNAPVFISYYQLNKENKGWGLKAGFGREIENGLIYLKGQRFSSPLLGSTEYERKAEYFYIIPQFVAYTKENKRSTFVISFGLPIGYSEDWLNQLHINDPIRGDYNSYSREENSYAGLEVELSYLVNVGKTMALKYGFTTGMKLIGDAPFQDVFENYNYNKVYYPGMYKNNYFNFQIGLLFSQFAIK